MRVYMPWGLIAIFVSLSLFYYISQKNKIKREERREQRREKNEAFLDALLNSNKKEENLKQDQPE